MEIQCQINRPNGITREVALGTSGRKITDRISLVVGYHPDLPPLSKILHDYFPILHVSERMKLSAPNPPLVANQCPQNLKELLEKVTLKPSQCH